MGGGGWRGEAGWRGGGERGVLIYEQIIINSFRNN